MFSSGAAIGQTTLVCFLAAALLYGPSLYRRVDRLVRARRASRRPEPPRTGRLVDDLRRLSRILAGQPPGTPWARQHGTQLAYDDVLVALCAELGVEHALADLPVGLNREMERLRVEDVIYGMGLRIHPVGT